MNQDERKLRRQARTGQIWVIVGVFVGSFPSWSTIGWKAIIPASIGFVLAEGLLVVVDGLRRRGNH